jgi:hypothetical protein
MSIPVNIDILAPWEALAGSERSASLAAQLETTLPEKHVLRGLKVTAVAARVDRDDVLFEVVGGEMPLAVVHLTWRKEMDSRWPHTTLFRDWKHWVHEDMQPAHEDYDL